MNHLYVYGQQTLPSLLVELIAIDIHCSLDCLLKQRGHLDQIML